MIIEEIKLKKILNSLGEYTLECEMVSSNFSAVASVPAGKSAGEREAKILSFEDAQKSFNLIKSSIEGKDYKNPLEFDKDLIALDSTENKSKLGGNLTLVLSIVFLKLSALFIHTELFEYISKIYETKKTIPEYSLLIFEGGKHGSNLISAQEYMLVSSSITESIKIVTDVKRYLDSNKLFCGYGLEGAFTSSQLTDTDVLKLLKMLFPDKKIAIDIAESSREGDTFSFFEIINNFNIYSIEDPCNENDIEAWRYFAKNFGQKVITVGDDLTTTNTDSIKKAVEDKIISGVIIKPNQIGTIYESVMAVKIAKANNLKVIVSHRGGDTNDNFLADFAVGVGADLVKFGGLQRGERIAKYNRLEDIKASLVSQI